MQWYVGPVHPGNGGAHWVDADTDMEAIEAWLRMQYAQGYEWNGCALRVGGWPSLGDVVRFGNTLTLPRNSLAVHAIINSLLRE